MIMFEALAYPFMQRALAAGVLVGVMTSLLGVLVVLRRSAFFGDAIAHAALTSYYVLLALVIIASIRTVGTVLVTALLVIPAATAKLLARSLRQMFVLTPLLGTASVLGGMLGSYYLDLPSGPAIVVLSGLIFLGVGVGRSACTWTRRKSV